MKQKNKKKINNHLTRSILLSETGSPIILRLVLFFLTIIIAFFLYWARNVELNQVVIASGEILTKDEVIEIQHPKGGVIKEIKVYNGQLVKPGEEIIYFDGVDNDLKIKETISKISTLNKRIELLKEELDVKKGLLDEQLISKTSYLTLERNYYDSIGERTQTYYQLEAFRTDAQQLKLVSPIFGYISYSKNRGKGTIIRSGETIFEIIPYEREFVAELFLKAEDRGRVSLNQRVLLKFDSYDFSKFGGMFSSVQSISVTSFIGSSNRAYYKITVPLEKGYIGNNENELNIIPGMMVSGEIGVGTTSLLEYLFIPVKVARDNSFNE